MSALAEERYDDLAQEGRGEDEAANQYVTFTCSDRAFGIEIMSVREIRSWTPTTLLPDQAFGALGVLDIRGKVVEVYDLAAMLGGNMTEAKPGNVVLVVARGDREVGILVDSVSDIIDARDEDRRSSPNGGEDKMVSHLISNEDRLVAILNLSRLFD